jgi:hypothetical protein
MDVRLLFIRGKGAISQGEPAVPLIQVVVVLVIIGVLLSLINRYIPMANSIKSILNAFVVICVIIWLLKLFGLWSYITSFHVGS